LSFSSTPRPARHQRERSAQRSSLRLTFFLLLTLASCVSPPSSAAREPLKRRLLRTIQIGAPQDVTLAEITRIAEDANSKYLDNILARSALLVLQKDDSKLVSYTELFGGVLNNLVHDSNAFPPLPDLPDFRGKETVFTMVYAMVMSGNQERATDVLEQNLLTGSKYKQALVLSALRNIGTPRAIGLIQKYSEAGQESNLAQTALADEDYPVLFEMHDRWNLIPPPQRTRDNLRAIVQSGCNQRVAMATYWLGFFAPNIDPNKEVAELQALEGILRINTPDCEMMEHVIALKALALRSRKSVEYWDRLARRTSNVWERHQIVINAWARFGRAFAPAALNLLATEPSQYVQWELLDGNLQTRQNYVYRPYWAIWLPANILVPMEFPESITLPAKREMDEKDLNALLTWLESSAHPKDPWVYNHMLYNLAPLVSADDTRRLLRLFAAHPERTKNYWIVDNLRDPSALPLLQYWSTPPAPNGVSSAAGVPNNDQLEILKRLVARLDNRSRNPSPSAKPCCDATELCLLEHVKRDQPSASPVEIHSDEEAKAWLNSSQATTASDVNVTYADELKRIAIVRLRTGDEQHWQFLYDCWHRTDLASTNSR
jgi:hypothetical protein